MGEAFLLMTAAPLSLAMVMLTEVMGEEQEITPRTGKEEFLATRILSLVG